MDFEEFTRITRHVEPEFFSNQKSSGLHRIFDFYAEKEEGEEEKAITPIKFKKLCIDYKIYSEEA